MEAKVQIPSQLSLPHLTRHPFPINHVSRIITPCGTTFFHIIFVLSSQHIGFFLMQTLSGIQPSRATIKLFQYLHLLEVRTPSHDILHMPSLFFFWTLLCCGPDDKHPVSNEPVSSPELGAE
jgi:hypothetical protein